MKKFPVWLISGRDANKWRSGKTSGFKNRPWLVAEFETEAEAEACKTGIRAAIGGMLNNVVFLNEGDAKRIDAEILLTLGKS